jgi:hypothetical protein
MGERRMERLAAGACTARFGSAHAKSRYPGIACRKWAGKRPWRKGWREDRIPALRGNCGMDSCSANFRLEGVTRHVHDILPARLIEVTGDDCTSGRLAPILDIQEFL